MLNNKTRTFQFDGKNYSIRFTNNALMFLEDVIGTPIMRWFTTHFDFSEGQQSVYLSSVDVQRMLWAGLEGFRNYAKKGRIIPLTDVGDMVDRIGEDGSGCVKDMSTGKSIELAEFVLKAFMDSISQQVKVPQDDAPIDGDSVFENPTQLASELQAPVMTTTGEIS